MNIIHNKLKFKRPRRLILLFVIASFLSGILSAVFLYKSAKMIPIKLNFEYIKKTGPRFISNYFNSNIDSLETIFLDIKYKEWRKLVNQRNEVWNYKTMLKYFPYQWMDSINKIEIKGKIRTKDEIIKVKLKLAGANSDHYGDTKKWSYRLSVKGDNVIDRQKKFNLLIPPSRNYVNEYISQLYLDKLDMISLRIKPVKLVLNGENMGVYLKEEFYDKRLIEYNNYRESAIIRLIDFKVNINDNQYLKYKTIIDLFNIKLDLYKNKKIGIDKLFNLDKMADRLGISILFGDTHSLLTLNQRYYLNPFTLKLEPLGREWHHTIYNTKNDVFKNITVIKEMVTYKELFKNHYFLNKINSSINNISSNSFINSVTQKHKIDNMKKIFHSEYPFFDSCEVLLNQNAKLLRDKQNWVETNQKTFVDYSILDKIREYAKINNDTILIDKSISISSKLHIPKGYKVIIKPGVQILLKEEGQILSESEFLAVGKKNDSIKFISNNKNNKGILFLNTKKSIFDYVKFKGINNYSDKFRTLPGSISFYESPVLINHSTLDTSYGGDDLLNIIRTDFEILNSEFLNSKADALDSDFSIGIIKNTLFKNIGNDAIDISGSNLNITNLNIFEVNDKAISAGEDSHVFGNNIKIYKSSLALTSKDLSTINLKDVLIDSCDAVFTVFQKKPEYGPASMSCQNVIYKNYKEEYLVQKNNYLNINSKEVKTKIKDVESKLYGALYGKSSK
jgi:hypothetical protein